MVVPLLKLDSAPTPTGDFHPSGSTSVPSSPVPHQPHSSAPFQLSHPPSAVQQPAPNSEPERQFHARRQLQNHFEHSSPDQSSDDEDSSGTEAAGPALDESDLCVPPRARPIDSSDDDMALAVEAPRFSRSHATYGDAEFFCRKVARVLKSGKYAAYPLPAQIAQLATYCDDATASRLDRLVEEGGVMVPPRNGVLRRWILQPGTVMIEAADGQPEVPAVEAIPAASLDDLLAWFVVQFSRKDVKRAAKKRLQVSLGQTTILDTHFEQIERDVKAINGSLDDDSQVDNILASISCYTVDEMIGYKGLGAVARDHHANPKTQSDIDTGRKLIDWLLEKEEEYIEAAEAVGAPQYWIGFKDRKLQTHPKRGAKGVHAIFDDPKVLKVEQRHAPGQDGSAVGRSAAGTGQHHPRHEEHSARTAQSRQQGHLVAGKQRQKARRDDGSPAEGSRQTRQRTVRQQRLASERIRW